MIAWFERAVHPVPARTQPDTGLRYTDILFGFVIKELFVRLSMFEQLAAHARWHLVVATALVLGSWVGFRRSLSRTDYDIKFFNLPFMRFVVDQLMLILYFKLAVLTPVDREWAGSAQELLFKGTLLMVLIFSLYLVWDVLGLRMATTRDSNAKPRYWRHVKDLETGKETTKELAPDWGGFRITLGVLAFLSIVLYLVWIEKVTAEWVAYPLVLAGLLAYRFVKELRTSFRP